MKKIIFNGQRRNKHFLIVIYHSSLVKGAMNAARLCKLRNGVSWTVPLILYVVTVVYSCSKILSYIFTRVCYLKC